MKKENKKKVVKTTKFSDVISNYRAERKLTQKQLGQIIGVSDRTISKWEKGDTEPDLYHVKKLCNKLNISPSNLVIYKKTTKDRINNLSNNFMKFLKYIKRNGFKILFGILFIYLLLFFINNYNSLSIYSLKYYGDNIYFNDGYFYKEKSFRILTLNNIELRKIDYEPVSYDVELYILLNGDKKLLYQANELKNIYIEESNASKDILSDDVIKGIKNGLTLLIKTTDENGNLHEYESKISLKEKYTNKNLFLENKYKGVESKISYQVFYGNNKDDNELPVVKEINTLEKLGFEYNKERNSFIKVDEDGGKIEFSPYIGRLNYTSINSDGNYQILINVSYTKDVSMIILKNNKMINKAKLKIKNNKILKENKTNDNLEKVQYLLNIYNEILETL